MQERTTRHASSASPSTWHAAPSASAGSSASIPPAECRTDGSYLWTRTFGGTGFDNGLRVALDASGNVFVLGTFRGSVDFDPGPGVDLHSASVIDSMFVTKLFADGSYAWTRTYPIRNLGGIGDITADSEGSVYLATFFSGVIDADSTDGIDVRTCNCVVNNGDIFVTKLFSDGSYAWTYTVGGVDQDLGHGVAVDDFGNVFVTGQFRNEPVDFDPGPGEDVHTPIDREDAFVTALTSDGEYQWTRTFGGPKIVNGRYIEVDPSGALIVAGSFRACEGLVPDLNPSCEVAERHVHFDGAPDAFITKLVCVEPAPDVSGDGAVDLADFARLQTCFTGDGIFTCGDGCSTLDLDTDDDIDLSDIAAFHDVFTGP